MSNDTDRSMRKMIREELSQLLDDVLTNITYIETEGKTLDWDAMRDIVRETAKDMDRKIDRLETP